jgi:hypothetical protein
MLHAPIEVDWRLSLHESKYRKREQRQRSFEDVLAGRAGSKVHGTGFKIKVSGV